MAPINFSAITFIPGVEFTFGSLNFVAGVDGKLHVSDPETTPIGRPVSDPADRVFIQSTSDSASDRFKDELSLPRYLFGSCNSANTFQHMLSQIMEDQAEHNTDMGEHGRVDSIIRPTYDEY